MSRRSLNKAEEQAWTVVSSEDCTKEDWEDLFYTIEEYKRRFLKRHLEAHLRESVAVSERKP